MDCKLGCRSFQEEEVSKKKLRPDLYERMLKLDPSAPTEEEKSQQGCTKYRWMSFNDKLTNLCKNCFRIDGVTTTREPSSVSSKDLKKLKTLQDAAGCIVNNFLPPRIEYHRLVAEQMIQRLKDMKTVFASSPFASRHSFIGCSALFVVDCLGPSCDVFFIDFAKTTPVPEGLKLDHTSPWTPGNHEDQLLVGLENLIKTWEAVLVLVSTSPNKAD